MLQTEEIDDDYFTPASSSSLANIFGKPPIDDLTENESLKYTPPKPALPHTSKQEEQKATQCVHACALIGYEWSNGAYIYRGKLGFAILKIMKTGLHNIILYDSKKVTLSNMTISTNFEVTVKENVYFSYLDSLKKYWCLYASEEELKKVINLLKSFDVSIKYSLQDDKEPPDLSKPDSDCLMKEIERNSDTDSSLSKKTKTSILNRMATVGHSVLPTQTFTKDKSSDSTDTDATNDYKSTRHKPVKIVAKRTRSEKTGPVNQSLVEAHKVIFQSAEHLPDNAPLFSYINGQIVPVTNSNLVSNSTTSTGNDMNIFISEQRVSNSELRININRMSDKMDQILSNVSHVDKRGDVGVPSNFQNEIMQKLLLEYENKIKMYENLLKRNKIVDSFYDKPLLSNENQNQTEQNKNNYDLSDKINQLEELSKIKDAKITSLESDLKLLQTKHEDELIKEKDNIEKLSNDIQNLNQIIVNKNEELSEIVKQQENKTPQSENDNDFGNKIKNIMNETFHAISANFDNDESYTGATIKNLMASVIKRVTIDSLSTL